MLITTMTVAVWSASAAFADSPIFAAVENRDLDAVKRILKLDPEAVHARTPFGGGTALMAVCDYIVLRSNLVSGTNFHIALTNLEQQNPIAEYLIEHGADVNAKNGWERTALMHAIDHQNVYLALLLIEKGADVNLTGSSSLSETNFAPLHEAGKYCYQVIPALVAHGAKINFQTGVSGRTPLHEAVYHHNKEAVRLLLEFGADPTIKEKSGETPLDIARIYCPQAFDERSGTFLTNASALKQNDGPDHRRQ
jgi:ankyrin repeat protein